MTEKFKLVLNSFICLLLILVVGLLAFQTITTIQQNQVAEQRAADYQTRVASARLLVDQQQDVINGLWNEYQKTAYGDKVDRIAEQQLYATEYSLQGLQILAIQNSQIIELLSSQQ